MGTDVQTSPSLKLEMTFDPFPHASSGFPNCKVASVDAVVAQKLCLGLLNLVTKH